MTTNEYVISGNGFKLRSIEEHPLELTGDFFAEMAQHAVFIRRQLAYVPGWGFGAAHARIHKETDYYSLRLNRIPLRCGWTVNDMGIMTPDFHRDVTPQFAIDWVCPDDMQLIMLSKVICESSQYEVEQQWLLAYHTGREECYRLPLANVHDDGRLCDDSDGNGRYLGLTPSEAITSAMTKFSESKWNADLWTTANQTAQMFRFQAQGDLYIQQACQARWFRLCQVIAPNILNEVVL